MQKRNLVSGITPSNCLTIAHYLVVIKKLVKLQENYNLLLFVADLHAVTNGYEPKNLPKYRQELLATYYACGFKPENVFVQSDILEHAFLMVLLTKYTKIGELKRMTQFKDKNTQKEDPMFGLLNYPILMAADILLYDADVVVGSDQKQHVELTRDLATRVNKNRSKKLFHVPELVDFNGLYRIRDLQNPQNKMSKSSLKANYRQGVICLKDSDGEIRNKILNAVTDSENRIAFDFERKPGVSNLILLFALCNDLSIEKATEQLRTLPNYQVLKEKVASAIIQVLEDLRVKQQAFLQNPELLEKYRQIGATNAQKMAAAKLTTIGDPFGFDF